MPPVSRVNSRNQSTCARMVPVTIRAAYSAAARLQHARATLAGITGPSRFPRPRGDSRRFVVARDIAVFGRESITREQTLQS